MSIETVRQGFWASLWHVCFRAGTAHEVVRPVPAAIAERQSTPVPPPPLIDAPHIPTPHLDYPAQAIDAASSFAGAAPLEPAADASNFMLSARLASTRILNAPKHRAGKQQSATTPQKKPDMTRKPRPKHPETAPKTQAKKTQAKARHVWLHGMSAAPSAAASSADIVSFDARLAAAPVTTPEKAKRAA